MSKMKKVISLVLCFALFAGTFAFLGDLIAPSASAAEGTTNVKTFAEVDAAYDKYVYVGLDVIEVANGKLTDGYVNAGDWLEYRCTILSDMYVGNSAPHIVYERDFFDVRVVTSTTPSTSTTFEKADYEGNKKFPDGSFMNPDHPYAAPNVPSYNTLTALPYTNVVTQMGFCEIDEATYSNWDFVKANLGVTTTAWNSNFPMTEDTWILSWYVRVKEGLKDGETGESFSPEAIYKHNINPSTGKGDSRRLADIFTADKQGTYASSTSLALRYNVVKHVLLDDCSHTFTIGVNPADNPEVIEKEPVTFNYVDGTVIETTEYAEGETIVIPEVANLIGWADSTGKLVEINTTMGQRALTYTAVLSTDKFDVKINLDGGAFAEDAALPEGAVKNADGSVTVKAAFGEEYDLTALPVPEKAGYKATWDPATVKVESTKGATAKVKWTADTFTAKFYLDKAAYEADAEALKSIDVDYKATLTYGSAAELAAMKVDSKFAGWINAATGEKVSSQVAIGAYNFTEDTEFYGDWTPYNSTVTVWGRDYANGGWKVLGTKYADAGTTLKINDLKAYVNEETTGTAAAQYVVAGSESTYSSDTAIRNDFVMAEGNKDVYIYTSIKFDVTFKVPVFDENGYITEEYKDEVKSVTSSATDDKYLTATILASAPAKMTGYKFTGWTDAEGNVYPEGNIAFDYANGTAYEFTAVYEEVEYTIEFIVNNASALKETIKAEGTYTVGDTFKLSEMTLVKEDGTEGILPEIGIENSEQAGGPYRNVNGYKFTGWKVGTQTANLTDFDITTEVEITPAVISAVTLNETISIKGFWEALYYDFVAHYSTGEVDAEGNLVYKAMPAVQVQTGKSLDAAYAAALETVNANLPEGKKFSLWKLEDGSKQPNNMPAYGVEVYATYRGRSLSIYLDYNYGTEEAPVELKDSMIKSAQYSKYLFDGVDVENDIPEGELNSIANMIRMSVVTSANRPGEDYEVVNWKIYYVESDNVEDIYNKENWREGISDIEGSTIAKYNLIFQVEWKAHKDFLFRVYNTDGALRSAIDKKFQRHFWYMNKPVDEENAEPLNALPERLIILGFLPKLDGFSFDRFFEADMWANISIRVDPISLSKAWLNPANWGALLEALFNGLSSGFGGAI
ncbi:MAG: hypothetical protein IJZ07_03255 [Clostridia bacterium]|nr:hypothetical protein [Clostridia bacterium]